MKQPAGWDSYLKPSASPLDGVYFFFMYMLCLPLLGWAVFWSNGTENNVHPRASSHVAGWHVDTWHSAITPPYFRTCPPPQCELFGLDLAHRYLMGGWVRSLCTSLMSAA